MLARSLSEIADAAPARTALVHGDRRVTYGELTSQVEHLAAFLHGLGVGPGGRVGIMGENSPELVVALVATMKAGAAAVDLNYLNSPRETVLLLRDSTPQVLMVARPQLAAIAAHLSSVPELTTVVVLDHHDDEVAPGWTSLRAALEIGAAAVAVPFPEPSPHDVANIVYTSGSSGRPKGVMLTHDNIAANAGSIISYLGLTAADKVLAILPFCYSYGKSLLTTHLMVGATLRLENSLAFPNLVLDAMQEEGVTGFAGVPSSFAMLLARSDLRARRFPALRYVTVAGAALAPGRVDELTAIFSTARFYVMYGQTEATARLAYLDPDDLRRKPGSIGKAVPGVTLELVKESGAPARAGEIGEIVASGRNVMAGYWRDPEGTRSVLRDGRLFTGDLATRDDEGFFFLVGRRSELIKSGGHRIAPKEIEEVVLDLPGVAEVAVVGFEDDILGQGIRAFVVPAGGARLEAGTVRAHCQERLATFKVPHDVVFVGSLPRTVSGKIRRHVLLQSPVEE